jgi:ABC-type cobalt transport system substrate-binding protein
MNKSIITAIFIACIFFLGAYVGSNIKEDPKIEITYTEDPGFNCIIDPETGNIECSLINPFDMTVEAWKERNQ